MSSMQHIDLQLKKLLEGLIDRKIVPVKWQEQIRALKQAIVAHYVTLPEAAQRLLTAKGNTNYYECKAVVTYLEGSEEGKKTNFFGQYTSPILKAWMSIVKDYEVDNVYVAEAARMLQQSVLYELPALRKTIVQHDKQITDQIRKIADCHKSIAEAKRKLSHSCAELKIPGHDFRLELQALVYELPLLFRDVARVLSAEGLREASRYHAALQAFLFASSTAVNKSPRFHALDQLWAAASVGHDVPPIVASKMDQEVEVISWEAASPPAAATIDWDIPPADAAEIEWDITMDDSKVDEKVDPHAAMALTTQVDLLLQSDFRMRITNDLLELGGFLHQTAQRKVELKLEDVAFANQFHTAAPILAHQSLKTTEGYVTAVQDALRALGDKRLQELLLIKSSPRYLDRLVSNLELQLTKIDKLRLQIQSLQDKNAELQAATAATHIEIKSLTATTKALRSHVEVSLPPLFKGHRVRIVGAI
ncbi:Aste57867_24587 [Aphanomyces stellatus]|uniref:Aste57867_24587 protein n=1 Tax=Aphanomyces stellatus TaxID=120398 RepID=A0A485LR01_9STRA|nr:hypothetical protein As57867_024509 [Aphanomyces stellatus]VFU01226.1 Aste57867_24587 [Aphanomyces stellatus]